LEDPSAATRWGEASIREQTPSAGGHQWVGALSAHVHAASLHDRDGAQKLLNDELAEKLPRLALLWADAAYTGRLRSRVRDERGWRVEVPRHPDRQLWRYVPWRRNRAASRRCLKEVGGGEDIRVAGASAEALAKDLRAIAADRGGHDLLGHEPDCAPQARQHGRLKCLKKGL
jgi:hypothetical protein